MARITILGASKSDQVKYLENKSVKITYSKVINLCYYLCDNLYIIKLDICKYFHLFMNKTVNKISLRALKKKRCYSVKKMQKYFFLIMIANIHHNNHIKCLCDFLSAN